MTPVETLREAARLMRERELFWSKVDRSGECWPWAASTRSNAYSRRDGYLNCRTCNRDAQARYATRRRTA